MKTPLLTLLAGILFTGSAVAQCGGQVIDNLTGGTSQHTSTMTSSWHKHEFDITFPTQYWNKTIQDPILYYRLDASYGGQGNTVNGGFATGDDGSPLVTYVNSTDATTTPPSTTQTDLYHVFDMTGQSLTIPSNGVVWFRFDYVSGNDRRREDIGTNAHTSTYQQNDNLRPGFTSFAIYAKSSGATISILDALCNGDSNGQGTVNAYGNSPFTYQWDSNANNQTDSVATGLSAGTYYVTVTDSLNCTFVGSAVVTEPDTIANNIIPSNVLCNGDSSGSANSIVTGGTPGYTYAWDVNTGNQTDSVATNLAMGTYYITVTDTNNCMRVDSITITEPTALANTMSSTAQQTSNCDGDATATPSGGTPAYSYQWDANANNQITGTATGLCGGIYYVTITDTLGCTYVDSIFVDYPASINGVSSSGSFKVFPNPANDMLQVRSATNGMLSLYNSNGKLILQKRIIIGNNAVDVNGLANGIYSATVYNAKQTETVKISVIH